MGEKRSRGRASRKEYRENCRIAQRINCANTLDTRSSSICAVYLLVKNAVLRQGSCVASLFVTLMVLARFFLQDAMRFAQPCRTFDRGQSITIIERAFATCLLFSLAFLSLDLRRF